MWRTKSVRVVVACTWSRKSPRYRDHAVPSYPSTPKLHALKSEMRRCGCHVFPWTGRRLNSMFRQRLASTSKIYLCTVYPRSHVRAIGRRLGGRIFRSSSIRLAPALLHAEARVCWLAPPQTRIRRAPCVVLAHPHVSKLKDPIGSHPSQSVTSHDLSISRVLSVPSHATPHSTATSMSWVCHRDITLAASEERFTCTRHSASGHGHSPPQP